LIARDLLFKGGLNKVLERPFWGQNNQFNQKSEIKYISPTRLEISMAVRICDMIIYSTQG
jgi:hypothetical protein